MTTSQPSARAAKPSVWWIYVALLERGGTSHFLYGCAAQTIKADIAWRGEGREHDLGGACLKVSERTLSDDDMLRLRADLGSGALALNAALAIEAMPAPVVQIRDVLQDGLGHCASRTRVFYTLPDVDGLFAADPDLFAAALASLQEDLNLPFKSEHASRLGAFEVFELGAWLDGPRPFLIEGVRNAQMLDAAPEALAIQRTDAFARDEHMAHIVGRVAGDVVMDRLLRLTAGERTVKVEVGEELDGVEVRLFDHSGERLIHHETSHFVNRFGIVIAMAAGSIQIDDELSRNARGGGAALHRKASIVGSFSPERSMIGAPKPGSWRAFVDDLRERVAAHLPGPSEDRWFPRGVEGEVDSIAHLVRLLDGGTIRSAILADPWFSATSIRRLLPRIGSRRIDVTIVTSLAKTDPDSGDPLPSIAAARDELAVALRDVRPLLNPRVRVVNVEDKGDQAFHDRYLVLTRHEGPPQVFMLSNSINRRAERWPLCMSLVAPDVSRDVRKYVEGLVQGHDTARGRDLQVTYRWPDHEA